MAAATVVRLDNSIQGYFSRLLASTSIVAPSFRSPFDGYGVVASGTVAARVKSLSKPRFGVREARDRLSDFIDGTFNPKSLHELMDYLSSRFMKLEMRIFDGRTANYLVDRTSKQAVLASTVDARLSRPGIAKRYGRVLEEQAEARRTAAITPEMIDARNLKARVSGAFRERRDNGTPFVDWDDVAFSAPALFANREMTVQGTEVWVGQAYDRASADPERNLRVIARAKAEGKKLIFPAQTKDSVLGGHLVPGMPILLRDGAVRTRFIDDTMTLEGMTRAFGISPFDHFRAIGMPGATRPDALDEPKVVQIDEFRKFRRAPGVRTAAPTKVVQSAEVANRCVVKHELDGAGREVMSFLDPQTGDEYPFDPATAPVGVFPKEDAFGLPTGWVKVDATGAFEHFDAEERHHNPYGPAIVPPKGSAEVPGYAVDGVRMSAIRHARMAAPGGDMFASKPSVEEPVKGDPDYDDRPGMRGSR